jgi:hypothetical protein
VLRAVFKKYLLESGTMMILKELGSGREERYFGKCPGI